MEAFILRTDFNVQENARRMPQTVNNAFLDKEFAHFEIISYFCTR